MKRIKLVWMCSALLTMALVATQIRADDPPPVFPEEQGIVLSGLSQESSTSLQGAYSGTAVLSINGETLEVISSSDPLVLTGLVDYLGQAVATSAHMFNLGNGNTLTTVDEVRLLPTQPGWFVVNGTMQITGGTGIFANADGNIAVYGQIHVDEFSVDAMSLLEGRVDGIGA
jgi:hypothetical protein